MVMHCNFFARIFEFCWFPAQCVVGQKKKKKKNKKKKKKMSGVKPKIRGMFVVFGGGKKKKFLSCPEKKKI
jgi:hypothetical protein